MQILFLCGSLQPGRDGVGDYARQLATECQKRGNQCALIALNEEDIETARTSSFGSIKCLHLPAKRPWEERINQAIEFRVRFGADWVSWQLVAYGLDSRGLVPRMLRARAKELCGPNRQVMVHELWLGIETASNLKQRALGWFQRRTVLDLLEQLEPACIDTSNATYRAVLAAAGFESVVLPLFGNIPVNEAALPSKAVLSPWLGSQAARLGPSQGFVAVTFGTLHPQWKADATAKWLKESARRIGKQVTVIAVGRLGQQSKAAFDAFRRHHISIVATGEQDSAAVSSLLQAADIGIAPHPWALIGKSGAAAAMLDHGLPVLVPRDDWHPRNQLRPFEPVLDGNLARLDGLDPSRTSVWLARRRPPSPTLPLVAHDFLYRLTTCSSNHPYSQ